MRNATQLLGVDEWDCVCALGLTVRDRRAFAATSSHARHLDREVWAVQRSVQLDDEALMAVANGHGGHLGWHELWYLAHLPLQQVRSGEEALDLRYPIDGPHNRGLRDPRLCACLAAWLVTDALRRRRSTHYHGVDLLRTATDPRASLIGVPHNTRALIAAIAALSQHPMVHAARSPRVLAQWPNVRSHFCFERLVGFFHGPLIMRFAVEALPWPWLWAELHHV